MNRHSMICAVLLLAFAGASQADPPGGERFERLAELLGLDDYQAGEVQRILTAQHEKRRAAHQEAKASGEPLDREAIHARKEAMKAETLQQLSGVLTPEQLAKFEGYMEARHDRWRHRCHGLERQSDEASADTAS